MGRLRIPIAVVAAMAATEVLVLLFRPGTGVYEPAKVSATSYFSPEQLQRAQDFRGPQLWLSLLVLAIQALVLAVVVRRTRGSRRGPSRGDARGAGRPVLRAAAAGAALWCVVTLAPLPVEAVMRERARDVGLVTRSWIGYAGDVALSTAIGALIAALGFAAAIALIRRLPRLWWLPGAGLVVLLAALSLFAGPLVLDRLFNRFTPLPAGETRDDVLRLAREAGVKVDKVYVMDASRRTTAANAYVTGLGAAKRVVLYDTMLKEFSPAETRLIVAHELGHVHAGDVPRGLLFVALLAIPGMLCVRVIVRRLDGSERAGPQTVPALAAALALVAVPATAVSNQLSRRVEARADSFSLRVTRDPQTFIAFQRKIAVTNISNLRPPAIASFLLRTHPQTIDRIGAAVAYAARERIPVSPGVGLPARVPDAPGARRSPAGS